LILVHNCATNDEYLVFIAEQNLVGTWNVTTLGSYGKVKDIMSGSGGQATWWPAHILAEMATMPPVETPLPTAQICTYKS